MTPSPTIPGDGTGTSTTLDSAQPQQQEEEQVRKATPSTASDPLPTLVPLSDIDDYVDSIRTTKAITRILKAQWDCPYISWTDASQTVQDRWFDTFSEQKEYREPSLFEVMQITKKNKAGNWVNQKTTDMAEAYQAMHAEKEAELAS